LPMAVGSSMNGKAYSSLRDDGRRRQPVSARYGCCVSRTNSPVVETRTSNRAGRCTSM